MDILAQRLNTIKLNAVPSTCKLHSIMNSSVPNTVNYRAFLCMCACCLHGDGPCESDFTPDNWKSFNLLSKKNNTPNLSIWKTIHKMPHEQQNWERILHIMSTFNHLMV